MAHETSKYREKAIALVSVNRLSYRAAAKRIHQEYGQKVDHATIYYWHKKQSAA